MGLDFDCSTILLIYYVRKIFFFFKEILVFLRSILRAFITNRTFSALFWGFGRAKNATFRTKVAFSLQIERFRHFLGAQNGQNGKKAAYTGDFGRF